MQALMIRLGERFGPVAVHVDEHMAKAYAFAQDDHGWLLSRAVRPNAPSPYVPALVLANRLLRVYEEKYERHANLGALHTRQELWYHQPISLGDTVTITGRYVDGYTRRGRLYVVLESTAEDQRGDRVVTSVSTEAMPESAGVELVGSAIPPGEVAQRRRPEGRLAPIVPTVPDPLGSGLRLVVGAAVPTLDKTMHQNQMSVFSGAGQYERNFHTDLEKAREAGFPRPVAQAMQSACYVGEWLASLFGEGWASTGWQDSRFLAPVVAGERLSVGGRVTQLEPDPAGTRVALDFWVLDGSGRATAVGRASGVTFGRPPRVSA